LSNASHLSFCKTEQETVFCVGFGWWMAGSEGMGV
jgi:hypothetical protein